MRSFGCFKSLEFTTSSGKHLCLSVAFTISFLFHTGKLLKTQHASRYLNSKLPRCENIEDAVHTLLLVITTSTLTIYMFTLADKKPRQKTAFFSSRICQSKLFYATYYITHIQNYSIIFAILFRCFAFLVWRCGPISIFRVPFLGLLVPMVYGLMDYIIYIVGICM